MNSISSAIRDFIYAQQTWAVFILAAVLFIDGVLYFLSPKLPRGSPPLVPYTIPWLGHAIAFTRDSNGFAERVKKQFPNDGITTLLLGGKTMYLVTDTNLASTIYRSSKSFAFDPLALLVSTVFGCNKTDMQILEKGANDYTVQLSTAEVDEKEPLLKQLHRMSSTELQGESLERMTNEFTRILKANVEEEFPKTETEEWRELELVNLVKRHFTLASIASLFGTKLIEREDPRIVYSWLWAFDPHVATLFTKLPDWIAGRAASGRDSGLEMLVRWERAAKSAEETGVIAENNQEETWDEYWGLKFTRDRAKLIERYGISERGRAGCQLALLWGQNANAIPCAVWVFIQALSPSCPANLLSKLHQEIQESTTPSGSLNFNILNAQPHLHSLLLETLRWTTSSPGVRIVQSDTQVGSYLLKQGGLAMVHARTLQLNSQIWGPNAETFDPSRFVPSTTSNTSKENEKLKKLSQRAFGGGQNLCPGRHFATNEILGGFAAIMSMLEIEVVEEKWEEPRVRVNDGKQGGLWPEKGVIVRVRRRAIRN